MLVTWNNSKASTKTDLASFMHNKHSCRYSYGCWWHLALYPGLPYEEKHPHTFLHAENLGMRLDDIKFDINKKNSQALTNLPLNMDSPVSMSWTGAQQYFPNISHSSAAIVVFTAYGGSRKHHSFLLWTSPRARQCCLLSMLWPHLRLGMRLRRPW